MKRRLRNLKIHTIFLCVLMLFSSLGTVTVDANSAQTSWSGTSATGAIIADDECPIIVEHEALTFDLHEFPSNYYNNAEDLLAYSGKVTAEYTFFNPADYSVEATLVFPFGNLPSYASIRNSVTDELEYFSDTEKYDVMLNDAVIEKRLRHTFSDRWSDFELDKDLALLHDDYVADAFYVKEVPVTKYTYKVSGVDKETYHAASAGIVWNEDATKTKLIVMEQNGGGTKENAIDVHLWVDNEEEYHFYVIGELPEEMPEWTFYENGAHEKVIEGKVSLISTETMTFCDLALSEYPEESVISETDWYNAMVTYLNQCEWEYGVISIAEYGENTFDIYDSMMRWYEYKITLKPGEKVVNTVTAPIYPSINSKYEPSIFGYTYLLSPAQTWTDFGNLDIVINTPYYITESNMTGWNKTENGYTLSLDGLPKTELEFTLSSAEAPERVQSTYPLDYLIKFYAPFIFIFALIIVLIILIIKLLNNYFKLIKKKDNSKK